VLLLGKRGNARDRMAVQDVLFVAVHDDDVAVKGLDSSGNADLVPERDGEDVRPVRYVSSILSRRFVSISHSLTIDRGDRVLVVEVLFAVLFEQDGKAVIGLDMGLMRSPLIR